MLQLKNGTPFAANLMLLPDCRGVDTVYTLVKATFSIRSTIALDDTQLPIAFADTYFGDPLKSSIRVPTDVSLDKSGTDVLLVGSARAPGDRPTYQVDVTVALGPVAKTIRVFADRVWDTTRGVATPQWLAPFVRMPMTYERAFGGSDETEKGTVSYRPNPVGAGFRAAGGAKPLQGLGLPNLEEPSTPISAPSQLPGPAAFAPVAPHWEPRAMYAGTYDDTWQRSRAPFLPNDFNIRYFQCAAAGLTAPHFLNGGESAELTGVTAAGSMRFSLPLVRLAVDYVLDRSHERVLPVLDTVLIDVDAERLVMVWRAALACDKKGLKVREVRPTFLN